MAVEQLDFVADFTTILYTRSANYALVWTSQIDLTGKNVQVIIVDPNGLRRIGVAVVDVTGTFATLTTTNTTFVVPGVHRMQFQVIDDATPPGIYEESVIVEVTVEQSL